MTNVQGPHARDLAKLSTGYSNEEELMPSAGGSLMSTESSGEGGYFLYHAQRIPQKDPSGTPNTIKTITKTETINGYTTEFTVSSIARYTALMIFFSDELDCLFLAARLVRIQGGR